MKLKNIARKIAEESIVLLKNEEAILPFQREKMVAFLGRAQIGTLYSGNGSGGANVANGKTILGECKKQGILPEPMLKGFYEYKIRTEPVSERDAFDWTKVSEMVNSGVMYEIFGKYHPPIPEYEVPVTLLRQASEKTDTAVVVLGRNSGGEECDRHLEEDYYLTASEKKLLEDACDCFAKLVVVLNTNGLIDLSWIEKYPAVKGLVFIGIPGEEGAAALAKILSGKINPSGRLAVTVAKNYKDYPSAEDFSWEKDNLEHICSYDTYGLSAGQNGSTGFEKSPVTVYREDIYNGYRYFTTFGVTPMFPFGYGLSYTEFKIENRWMKKQGDGVLVSCAVTNVGAVAGKEVVQVYLEKEHDPLQMERPKRELKGFEKTNLLKPGKEQKLKLLVPWRELAAYDTEQVAWIIESGSYDVAIGTSSANTESVGRVKVEAPIIIEKCANRLGVQEWNQGKLEFLSRAKRENLHHEGQEASGADLKKKDKTWEQTIVLTQRDVKLQCAELQNVELRNMEEISDLSTRELAALCVGYGPGTPFSAVGDRSDPPTIYYEDGAPVTTNNHPTGFQGYVSPALEKKGIDSVFYKDGPAGIGGIAWPTEMLIACSFDKRLWKSFGRAVGEECAGQKVNVWLAPAVNLHRNPLCGRNFEYFSEDPYVTGVCASEIAKGAQSIPGVLVCPKHFAVNEQETFRRGNKRRNVDAVDSILTERAVRELYLKPFELLVKKAEIACIMTSFNKINGVFAGGSRDLCTHILRDEWGFSGVVVSDWGDMDIVVDGADAVAAGNDVVMPGGPPVIREILQGFQEGRITRAELIQAVKHLLIMIDRVKTGGKCDETKH